MKLRNHILSTLLAGATALALTSCNDFLDRDPLGQFTEDDAPNALVGGKMYNVYYLMRSYNITAGIPAFMVHMVRSEDSEKGSDAGDGADNAAMWDDFEYTASNGYWVLTGTRTTKSSISVTKSWTILKKVSTKKIQRTFGPKVKHCSSAPTATLIWYVPGGKFL